MIENHIVVGCGLKCQSQTVELGDSLAGQWCNFILYVINVFLDISVK